MAKNGLQRAVIACAVVLGLVEIVAPGGCVSAAGEAGQHIAQLPSTEAKCKFVLELCARARRYDAAYLSAKKDRRARFERRKHRSIPGGLYGL